jgi:hypothetical protein
MDLVIDYDLAELKGLNFPKDTLTEKITEKILFMTPEEAREELKWNRVLEKIVPYSKPYRLQMEGLEIVDEKIVLFIKVKDRDGVNTPRLIPYKKAWFLIGTGPHSKGVDVEMVNDRGEYVSVYNRLFGEEHSFAYFCTLDETLEIIDWHSFYDFYDEENKKYLEQAKKEILKKYSKWMKKTGPDSYLCIMD